MAGAANERERRMMVPVAGGKVVVDADTFRLGADARLDYRQIYLRAVRGQASQSRMR